ICVAEEFLAIAAEMALLVESRRENAKGSFSLVPAGKPRALRRPFVRKIIVIGLPSDGERRRGQVERVARDDVDRAADSAFGDVGFARLVDLEPTDDLGWQEAEVEAAAARGLVEHEP